MVTHGEAYAKLVRPLSNNPQSSLIVWITPPVLEVKLNSDGNCLNGHFGRGGKIRDHKGNFNIFAYSISLRDETSNTTEAEAMLFGLKWCTRNDFDMAIGETDSI